MVAVWQVYLASVSSGALLFWVYWFNSSWASRLAALIAGFCWAMLVASQHLQHRLPSNLEGEWLSVQGQIVSLPVIAEHRVQFEFEIQQFEQASSQNFLPLLVQLNLYHQAGKLSLGDKCHFQVKLKRPHGFADPGVVNYERWLFHRGIGATGYLNELTPLQCQPTPWWRHPFGSLRQTLDDHFTAIATLTPQMGFIKALVICQRNQIDLQQWLLLSATGTAHLLAISGLHIGFIAGIMFFCWRWLWRRSSRLCLWIAAPRAAAVAALLAAWFYAGLAGFGLPTQRAVIMITVVMWTWIGRQTIAPLQGFAIALLLVLLCDPLATLSAGFWLSFAAVAAIFYGLSGRIAVSTLPRWQSYWWRWGRIQWVMSVLLLPLSLWFFHQSALLSFVANSFAIPMVGLMVMPLSLLATVMMLFHFTSLSSFIFVIASKILQWVLQGLMLLQQVKIPNLPDLTSGWQLLFMLFSLLQVLAPIGWSSRWLALPLILPVFFHQPPTPAMGDLWLTVLDVGQGLSVLIQTAKHSLVYDTGPKYSPQFDVGRMVLLPVLRQAQIHRVDTLMVSHGDNDHIGGAAALLAAMPVNLIVSSVPEKFKPYQASSCYSGQAWQWDGVTFRVLYPPQQMSYEGNDSSCVLQIRVGKTRILLPGDIEHEAERYLLQHQDPTELRSQIIIAPHHGSKTSSTLAFLQVIKPTQVIYPTGYRNRFNFPNQSVLERYKSLGVVASNTAIDGSVMISLDQNGNLISLNRYRSEHHYLWD